jgi:nucleoside-diphosphate-sugar epimerase
LSTLLIFGASGATGKFLLPRLLAANASVLAVSRVVRQDAPSPQLRWLTGDLFNAMPPLPAGVEVLVSLGPLDAFATWFEGNPSLQARRVIALSSMSTLSKQASADPAERELAARLQAAEQRLASAASARNIAWTILRPTLIYGDGRDRSLAPIVRFARRWRVMPLPIGADGLRQPVHADDLAVAVVDCVDCAAAVGKTYSLGGGERLRFDELLRRLRCAQRRLIVPLPVPLFILRVAGWMMRRAGGTHAIKAAALRRLREPLVADNSAATRDFGYAPRAFDASDVLPEK